MNFDFLDLAAGLSLSVHATEYLEKKFIEISYEMRRPQIFVQVYPLCGASAALYRSVINSSAFSTEVCWLASFMKFS